MMWQMMIGYLLALGVGVPPRHRHGPRAGGQRHRQAVGVDVHRRIGGSESSPFFIILMGRGLLFSTAIVFVVTVWYVVVSVTEAARAVSPKLIDVARSFAASDVQRFRHAHPPGAASLCADRRPRRLRPCATRRGHREMFISAGYGGAAEQCRARPVDRSALRADRHADGDQPLGATTLMRWAADRATPRSMRAGPGIGERSSKNRREQMR